MPLTPLNPFMGTELVVDVGVGKVTADFAFMAKKIFAPIASNAAKYKAAVTLHATDPTVVTTFLAQPDIARQLKFTLSVNTIAGAIVIVGTDISGNVIGETVTMTGLGGTTWTTLYAYKTITSITLPARTTAGDTIAFGSNETIGLPYKATYDQTVMIQTATNGRELAWTVVCDPTYVGKILLTITGYSAAGTDIIYSWML